MSGPVHRFAPSPTGRLHIGNARSALLNGLLARRNAGRFILRLDDTDQERSRQVYADAIVEDLAWLGLKPDLLVRQSDRTALYDAAADRLRAAGRLYPCYETEDELDRRRKRQAARGLPPVYDRAALKLGEADRAALEAEGRRPHWRFLLELRTVAWTDLVRGECHVDCASLSDPVLVRADGTYLYTLPSVVDDIDLGVTDVVRGEDHVTNTAVQIQIIEALAGASAVPRFGHHNLFVLPGGEGLSKRQGHLSLGSLREAGLESLAVAIDAVLLGSSEPVRPLAGLDELAGLIDLAHLSRAPARFDETELAALNARLLHHLPYSAVADRLTALGVTEGEAFWLAVRGNLALLREAAEWRDVVRGPLEPAQGRDEAFLAEAARLLPQGPYDETSWGAWTGAVKEATGRKGRDLFMPLRLALTGREHGPELKALLPLIGEAQARARLTGERG
ncbi:MAG: glutamate--tRNA ligase [Alsobacter sp.]